MLKFQEVPEHRVHIYLILHVFMRWKLIAQLLLNLPLQQSS